MNMQAAIVDFNKGILSVREIARPEPGKGQVLVRIVSSGVNPLDSKIRTGKAPHARVQPPAILGTDLAGIVESLGQGVTQFRAGDQVYGFTGGVGNVQGSLAEFAAVDAALLGRKPANVTMREGAALPLVLLTAWEGLVDRAQVKAGDTVLVTGGTGGVGHIVVQLAKALGATVFATASAAKHGLVQELGATPIDRETPAAEILESYAEGKGFDVVYDTVGGAPLDTAFQVVRDYGQVVSCYGWGTHDLKALSRHGASYSGVFVLLPILTGNGKAHHGEILREATRLVEAGKIMPILDPRQFTLETANEAHAAVGQGGSGKIVVDIGGPWPQA